MEYDVRHNIEQQRFEVIIDNLISEVDYYIDDDGCMRVTHTEVPPELEGKGIAAAMTKALLEYAKENSITVIPVCPYTKAYIEKHPEYNIILN